MAIQIDEAFLRSLSNVMVQLSADIPASPNGPIENLLIKPGHPNFTNGVDVAGLIRMQGGAIKKYLVEVGTTASQRAIQLNQFIQMTDKTEAFNGMTALEFLRSLPAWATGPTGPTK
jgi:hypothetical protein